MNYKELWETAKQKADVATGNWLERLEETQRGKVKNTEITRLRNNILIYKHYIFDVTIYEEEDSGIGGGVKVVSHGQGNLVIFRTVLLTQQEVRNIILEEITRLYRLIKSIDRFGKVTYPAAYKEAKEV